MYVDHFYYEGLLPVQRGSSYHFNPEKPERGDVSHPYPNPAWLRRIPTKFSPYASVYVMSVLPVMTKISKD